MPEPTSKATRAIAESINVLEQQTARLQLRVLEGDAQVGDLQAKLDEARQEVVRAMAKLQTLASKAEAASGMAEAEIALQALQTAAGQLRTSEAAQAEQLLRMSTKEFDQQNYGGALYLANQAKNLAGGGQTRLTSSVRGALRPGEVLFALPLRLQTLVRGNVRDGPGTNFSCCSRSIRDAAARVFVRGCVGAGDRRDRPQWVDLLHVCRKAAGGSLAAEPRRQAPRRVVRASLRGAEAIRLRPARFA